jgi:hypothetical protein
MDLDSALEQQIALSTIKHVKRTAHIDYTEQHSPILDSSVPLPLHHSKSSTDCVYEPCIQARRVIYQQLRMKYMPECPFIRETEQYQSPCLYRSSGWFLLWDFPVQNREDRSTRNASFQYTTSIDAKQACFWKVTESLNSDKDEKDLKHTSLDLGRTTLDLGRINQDNQLHDGLGDSLRVTIDDTRSRLISWTSKTAKQAEWIFRWDAHTHQILYMSNPPSIPAMIWNEYGLLQSIGQTMITESRKDESRKGATYEYWPSGRLYPLIRMRNQSILFTSLLDPLRTTSVDCI